VRPGDGASTNSSTGEGGGDQSQTCTTSDLTPNTPVHEAELDMENGQAVFEKVEVLK
jgi:hypothetical protein